MAATDPTILIVAYRNTRQLSAALASLGPGQSLVVVDNGREPEVGNLVAQYGGAYVAPDRNVGFAAGVNIGLRECRGRDVLLLNPDVLLDPGLPRALAAALHEDERTAAVAPALRYPDGSPQRVVWPIPSPREDWVDALKLRRLLPPRRTFMIGAVLLLRAEALVEIGEFDERFFLYAEECDWQLRALRGGWKLRAVEDLEAVHAAGGSSDAEDVRVRHSQASAELFARKWYGPLGWTSMRTASLVGTTLRLAFSLHRPAARARYARRLRTRARV